MTAPTKAGEPQMKAQSRLFRTVLAVLATMFFILFVSLGIWQIERLQWKHALIARIDARVHAEAVAAPERADWPRVNRESDEYRRVSLTGTYLSDKQILVNALTERGAGYWVLTPLQTSDGAITFLNRGFIPTSRRNDAANLAKQNAGEVTVTGLLRMPEPDGFFLRPNDPARNEWNSRDVVAFSQKQGLGEVAPYFIDVDAQSNPDNFPVGGLTVITFRDNHLSYALTWFALAAMVAGATIFVWRHENRPKV